MSKEWKEGLIVHSFKKGDKEEPCNYRGVTLLSVVGKVFCKILNNILVECVERERALHEGQAGFRKSRSCLDNVYTLNEIVQGRLREDKPMYTFFRCIESCVLVVKMWDMGVKGKMCRVLKGMYEHLKVWCC